MPSGPSLFDDEVAPSDSGADRQDGSDQGTPATVPSGAASARKRSRGPNYMFRRAVVVGGVVAVLATASIVIGQMIGSGADTTESGAIGAEWNRIVLVDDRTGRVIIDDTDGEELARIESGRRNPTASAVVDSTLVVTAADGATVMDIGAETVDEFDLGADVIVTPAGSALTMIAPRPDGGRGLLVHGPSGDVVDTDTLAPVVGARYEFAGAIATPSGREVLVTDSGNFQSVLFSFDRDEPAYFPGLALAVDADLVVTAQNVGADATINVFDHAGEPLATGRTPSVRAGIITGAGIVLVTVDGAIITMAPSSGETTDRAQLDIGTIESGDVTTSGDRLVVIGATGTAIVDDGGAVIDSYDGQVPAGTGEPPTGSTCLGVVTSSDAGDQPISLIDLTDGSVLVEASGTEPVLADASGCTLVTTTAAGYDLLGPDGVQQFETVDTPLTLSLDGTAIAAERNGRIVLIDATEPADDPIDLGPRGRSVHFTQS